MNWIDGVALGKAEIESLIQRANSATVRVGVQDDVPLADEDLVTEDVTPEIRRLA